jgi:hypothetical protein
VAQDISCSVLRPPNTTATLTFVDVRCGMGKFHGGGVGKVMGRCTRPPSIPRPKDAGIPRRVGPQHTARGLRPRHAASPVAAGSWTGPYRLWLVPVTNAQ